MRRCWFVTFAFLLFSFSVAAQQRDMKLELNTGTKDERVQRLVALGVERDTADEAFSPSEPILDWQPVRTNSRQQNAILFLPCSHDSAHLYLMMGEGTNWSVSDRLEIDCHYDNSVSVEVSPVRSASFDDLLIHHAGQAYGTGYSEQHFKVVAVDAGKFKVLRDTEEVVTVNRTPEGSFDRVQRSTFTLIPAATSLSFEIKETRSIVLNGKLTVHRRLFRWDRDRFVSSKFLRLTGSDH